MYCVCGAFPWFTLRASWRQEDSKQDGLANVATRRGATSARRGARRSCGSTRRGRSSSRGSRWVLLAEIVALCSWIALKGLSAEYQTNPRGSRGAEDVSGLVFRALIGAVVLGIGAHFALRDKDPKKRRTDTDTQASSSPSRCSSGSSSRGSG